MKHTLAFAAFVTVTLLFAQNALAKQLSAQPFICLNAPDNNSLAEFRNKQKKFPLYVKLQDAYLDLGGAIFSHFDPVPSSEAIFSMDVTPTATSDNLRVQLSVTWTAADGSGGSGLFPNLPTSITSIPNSQDKHYVFDLTHFQYSDRPVVITGIYVSAAGNLGPSTPASDIFFNNFVWNGVTAKHDVAQAPCVNNESP